MRVGWRGQSVWPQQMRSKKSRGRMARGTGAFALSALEGTGRFAAAGDVV